MTKILKLSNDVKITKSNIDILEVTKKFSSIPVTTKSWLGCYYSPTQYDVHQEGYTLLTYKIIDWNSTSTIYDLTFVDDKIEFRAPSSTTIGNATIVFYYIRD